MNDERVVHDTPDVLASRRLLDLLGHESGSIEHGDPLPPLAHWLHFGGVEPFARCGPDGHGRRGDFLPALPHLPRRMWAGGRITFHEPLRAGHPARKRSRVGDVSQKQGRSGPLAFATVHHEIEASDGRPLVSEEQTLVFREAPRGPTPRTGGATERPHGTWHREVVPDAVMLFRYSALTFNSHRIHYDADYVRDVENYPGLVIHGPLTATLLLDLALRNGGGASVASFSFQARAPLCLGDRVALDGEPGGTLTASTGGAVAMEARFDPANAPD